jgi:hypothetical protein
MQFKSDIKEGQKCTYNMLIWLGSKEPPQIILNLCILEWDQTKANCGTIKMTYKQVQSLHTSRNLMRPRVPIDLDADALQILLKGKMEEARQKMVVKNPFKYRSITKVPEFVLEKDFIRHTPYAERSKGNDVPFWAKLLFCLKYLKIDEDKLEHILAVMYWMKQLQGLFGDAFFYHRNPGLNATAGVGCPCRRSHAPHCNGTLNRQSYSQGPT